MNLTSRSGGQRGWPTVFIKPPKILRALIAVGVLAFLFGWGAASIARAINKPGDYYKYVAMGKGVLEGFNPYDADQEKNRWPPFLAIAYLPFAAIDHFSPAASRIVFLLLSYWAFYDALRILVGRLYGKQLSLWPRSGRMGLTEPAVALAVLLCSRYLSDTARYIQPTFILLWLSVKSLEFLEKDKEGFAGLLTGFAASLKLTPIIWIGYFVLRGRLKAASAAVLSMAVFFLSPFAVLGPDRAVEYYQSWLSADKMYSAIPTRASNESVYGMFERSIGDKLTSWSVADPFYGGGASSHPWILPLTLLFLLVLGLAWMFCAGEFFRERPLPERLPLKARRIVEEGLVLQLALYASPLSWKHYYMLQVYLLLGLVALLAWDLARGAARSRGALALVVFGALLQSNIWIPFMSTAAAERIQDHSLIFWGSLCYFTAGLIYLRTLSAADTAALDAGDREMAEASSA